MTGSRLRVLLYCHHTLACEARSGIQRVVVEAGRALAGLAKVELVKWDDLDGQLRYLTDAEISRVFGRRRPDGLAASRYCSRVNYRFGETVEAPDQTWLLFPEIPYHQEGGNEKFARLLSQCKAYGIQTACIFYDLIPIRDPDYAAHKGSHVEYVLEALRCDRIFAISHFAGDDLKDYFRSLLPQPQAADASEAVVPVPLGERDTASAPPAAAGRDKRIVLLGTVEPRKQQTRFLRVFNDLLATDPQLRDYAIDVFGSLHPASAEELHRELRRNPAITYHRYATDQEIRAALDRSAFSAFISRSEGYGLPIVESLHRGVPCLTSNFGAMAEVAQGGGCLLVDSREDAAIADGIRQLTTQPELLQQLAGQTLSRATRTWSDYARALLDGMATSEVAVSAEEIAGLLEGKPLLVAGVPWIMLRASSMQDNHSLPWAEQQRVLGIVDWSAAELATAGAAVLERLCQADVLAFVDPSVFAAFPGRLRDADVRSLPTDRVGALSSSAPGSSWLNLAIAELSRHSRRLEVTARHERMLSAAARSLKADLPKPPHDLAIVISTYNRAAFCELNVRWLLELLRKYGSRVHLTVVDNASTDDSAARLGAFLGQRNFSLIVNPSNTGMLGNLQVCSTLRIARHVWLIGDDDFIHDHAIEAVLAQIDANPRCPLISTNFAVYHRQSVAEGDSGERYIREGHSIAPTPPSAGPMKVIGMTEIHDNIFTAIYPLIFRSDLMAACFNYPFDGEPFQDLVESVPTTKFILEFLSRCEGYWLDRPGITGNAHNSWSKFRPRWHSVLIPRILQLARESGMSPGTGWRWLAVHGSLFAEAIDQADHHHVPVNLSPAELDRASWLFRQPLGLPDSISTHLPGQPPLFARK